MCSRCYVRLFEILWEISKSQITSLVQLSVDSEKGTATFQSLSDPEFALTCVVYLRVVVHTTSVRSVLLEPVLNLPREV